MTVYVCVCSAVSLVLYDTEQVLSDRLDNEQHGSAHGVSVVSTKWLFACWTQDLCLPTSIDPDDQEAVSRIPPSLSLPLSLPPSLSLSLPRMDRSCFR